MHPRRPAPVPPSSPRPCVDGNPPRVRETILSIRILAEPTGHLAPRPSVN
jgi:hypothetical protein